MDEFGDPHGIYVWPVGHTDGDPFPKGFWGALGEALDSVGIDWEYI